MPKLFSKKSMREAVVKMHPVIENGQHVWVVSKGWKSKYAWPANGKSSLEIAKEMMENWQE